MNRKTFISHFGLCIFCARLVALLAVISVKPLLDNHLYNEENDCNSGRWRGEGWQICQTREWNSVMYYNCTNSSCLLEDNMLQEYIGIKWYVDIDKKRTVQNY